MFRSESEFVQWVQRTLPRDGRQLSLGVGDDAALVEVSCGKQLILSVDLFIQDVHFSRHLHRPRSVGHRALARSLSDIAAMGGKPRFVLVSMAVPRDTKRSWITQVYKGMTLLAQRYGVSIVGGDTALVSQRALLDVAITGEVQRRKALLRSGAHAGDILFVSGRLGLAALGLQLLASPRHRQDEDAIRRHLFPEPQCALGHYLSHRSLASAAIDVSDGLSTDLHHLCDASNVGACVWQEKIPGPDPMKYPSFTQESLQALVLNGGEDYQLLFTVSPRKASQVPKQFRGLALHPIGEITASRNLFLVDSSGKRKKLRPLGWDHFRRQS